MLRRKGTDPALSEIGLPGEILFIGAILRQALCDARLDQPSQTPMYAHEQAKTFLKDQSAINWWAGLLGADGETLGDMLRQKAGLDE